LCLDEENQYDLTDSRIEQWCQQVVAELADI
jgi:flavodoxin II